MLPDNVHHLPSSKKNYPLKWFKNIEPQLDNTALIKGYLLKNSLSVVYGQSNSGKTFFAIDLALSIAAGREWNGRRTARGLVLYVAAEGPHSVINRVYAYKKHVLNDYDKGLPFAIIPVSIDLLNFGADTEQLISFIQEIEEEFGEKCELLIVDTLARAMAGGNENGFDDMSAVVSNADRIRQEVGCAFMFVHHAGKDATKGARGHTSLRAATDTEIEITNSNGSHMAKVTKQRDLPGDDELSFNLEVVDIGLDNDGDMVTSCYPKWTNDIQKSTPKKRLSPQLKIAFDILKETIKTDGLLPPTDVLKAPGNILSAGQKICKQEVFRTRTGQRNLSGSDSADNAGRVYRRCLKDLQAFGFIQIYEDYIWCRTSTDKYGQK